MRYTFPFCMCCLTILHESVHYENTPMQYTEKFLVVKKENFHWKMFDIFLLFLLKT